MYQNEQVKVFKALADPTRLELVRQLARCSGGTKSCGSLSSRSELSQPALSHHFAKLVSAEIVYEHKDGQRKYYTLNKKLLQRSGLLLHKL